MPAPSLADVWWHNLYSRETLQLNGPPLITYTYRIEIMISNFTSRVVLAFCCTKFQDKHFPFSINQIAAAVFSALQGEYYLPRWLLKYYGENLLGCGLFLLLLFSARFLWCCCSARNSRNISESIRKFVGCFMITMMIRFTFKVWCILNVHHQKSIK